MVEILQDLELDLLIEAVYRQYGYDFRDYSRASFKRRIGNILQSEKLGSISSLQERILHDPASMERFLLSISVNVTAMFRDPLFFKVLREKVVPVLQTYPFIRIWSIGCSTGEEVYSVAILLEEEGLLKKCKIYATDMNESVISKARDGIFPVSVIQEYNQNYIQAGGMQDLSEYYTTAYDNVIFAPFIKDNIFFTQHNLTTDYSFNEFNLILCRNVMIYFNKKLQDRVHKLIYDSLISLGFLCLGSKESLRTTIYENYYKTFSEKEKIYRKV